jgi:hypothetical protein
VIFGHYSAAFAGKVVSKPVPLWVYFIATQWLDVCWSVLLLLDVEKVRIVPGFTEAHPLDHYYFPYSHGLVGAIILPVAFGGVVALTIAGNRRATFIAVSAVAFSHWIFDFLVHVPDLPLYDDAAKVGLGLWRHVEVSFTLELGLLIAGAWIFALVVPTMDARGRYALWAFVTLLALMHAYTTFGPPPGSEKLMAVTGLAFYLGLAALAAWVERSRGMSSFA